MVCAKCQKRLGATALATPGVKKKTDMYYGSPAGSKTTASSKTSSATLGDNGVGKVRVAFSGGESIKVTHQANSTVTEQATVQICKEPIRQLLRIMYHMQEEDRSRPQILPNLRLQVQRWALSPCLNSTHLLTQDIACAACGKSNTKTSSAAPTVAGQKFTLK